MAGEYIFTMRDLRKVVPPSREILKGIHLSFFPGAKIGVLGANGAGKSSLLRIMAGVDKDFLGDARPLPGTRIGFLPQEPQLDPTKDVRGNVRTAVREQQALLDQFNEISAKFAEPMDDDEMTRLLEKQGNLQERIDALGLWELDHKIDIAMDALRLPPGDADVDQDLRRRAPPRRALPAAARGAGHAAARRAHQPPRRRERLVARALPGGVPGHGRRRHARPLLPRQRRRLDPRAGPGRGHSRGRATTRRGWSRSSAGSPRRRSRPRPGRRRSQRELEWVRMAPRARQAKSKARITRYEELREEAERQTEGSAEILIPVPERLGDEVVIASERRARGSATGSCSRT